MFVMLLGERRIGHWIDAALAIRGMQKFLLPPIERKFNML